MSPYTEILINKQTDVLTMLEERHTNFSILTTLYSIPKNA